MTSIVDFYAGRTVFVTGATGFMGKVLLEKLLRSCPTITKIYVLIRPKKGFSVEMRLTQLLESKDADETIMERLIGLTEMFPERLRTVVSHIGSASWEGSKWLFHVGRIGIWVVASSATILALPVMFESERNQMEEQQIQQQRQLLLGPNAAMSGVAHPGISASAMPQVAPPTASR